MPYSRIAFEEIERRYLELMRDFQAAPDAAACMDVLRRRYQLNADMTPMELCYVRHDMNVNDPFYAAEQDYYNDIGPRVTDLSCQLDRLIVASPFRAKLEETTGALAMAMMEEGLRGSDSRLIPLAAEENELLSRHNSLTANAVVQWEGKPVKLNLMTNWTQSRDREVRRRAAEAVSACWQARRGELEALYGKLVANRNRQAEVLGLKSYAELSYHRMYRIGYGPEEVGRFRDQVKRHLVPLLVKLDDRRRERLGLEHLYSYDAGVSFPSGNPVPRGDTAACLAATREMYTRLSPETAGFIEYLLDSGLYDVEIRDGKRGGGYMMTFERYRAPFIFANFDGTSENAYIMCHEGGHAFQAYDMAFTDVYYTYALPKSDLIGKLGFWDGCSNKTINQQTYDYYESMGAIVEVRDSYESTVNGRTNTYYDVKLDSYRAVGYTYINLTPSEYQAALDYQDKTGVRLFHPMVNTSKVVQDMNKDNANYWYEHDAKGIAKRDENGAVIPIYKADESSEDGLAYCAVKMGGSQYQVRVYYYDWFTYINGQEPCFLFGTDNLGHDILSRLASGARFSLMLSVIVSALNFLIGTAYGAIEGYYGGKVDMVMERIVDVLYSVPYMVLFSLLQLRWGKEIGVVGALLLAFVLTGWIGVASTVRTQFYRYKGQEYVLAARTLGASDARIIARSILPNSLGTIITACVLMVPSVIFTESSLSYLGVLNLDSSTLTSVGTMLSNGQTALSTYPHAIFFPALFISLMMISFNLFGNGLRDALNPTLRGAEE